MLALAPGAMASVGVGSGAAKPTLRVDAKGNAEVSYTQGGARRTLLVPLKGAVIYSGRLTGPDVSKAATQPEASIRQGAPQRPRRLALRAADVAHARRRARAPVLALAGRADEAHVQGEPEGRRHRPAGNVTYAGKPIPTTSKVPGGSAVRQYVYLDQRVDGKWQVLGGASVTRGGTYKQVLHGGPSRSALRASVAGPNIGAVYAPDMTVQIPPP